MEKRELSQIVVLGVENKDKEAKVTELRMNNHCQTDNYYEYNREVEVIAGRLKLASVDSQKVDQSSEKDHIAE